MKRIRNVMFYPDIFNDNRNMISRTLLCHHRPIFLWSLKRVRRIFLALLHRALFLSAVRLNREKQYWTNAMKNCPLVACTSSRSLLVHPCPLLHLTPYLSLTLSLSSLSPLSIYLSLSLFLSLSLSLYLNRVLNLFKSSNLNLCYFVVFIHFVQAHIEQSYGTVKCKIWA